MHLLEPVADEFERFAQALPSVAWSFSSTVRRISSSLAALSAWMAARRSLSAVRGFGVLLAALHHAHQLLVRRHPAAPRTGS